jgi:hypothetical protein
MTFDCRHRIPPHSPRWASRNGQGLVHWIDWAYPTDYGLQLKAPCGSYPEEGGAFLSPSEPLTCLSCIRCRAHVLWPLPLCDRTGCTTSAAYELIEGHAVAYVCRPHLGRVISERIWRHRPAVHVNVRRLDPIERRGARARSVAVPRPPKDQTQ